MYITIILKENTDDNPKFAARSEEITGITFDTATSICCTKVNGDVFEAHLSDSSEDVSDGFIPVVAFLCETSEIAISSGIWAYRFAPTADNFEILAIQITENTKSENACIFVGGQGLLAAELGF